MPDGGDRFSGNGKARREDRRVLRTRAALVGAFNRLVLFGRKRHIAVGDIVAEAGVGRSTFYEHFGSAEALHMHALARPLEALADAAAGRGEEARLVHLLEHFWENRRRARETFAGRAGEQAGRLLANMVEERLGDRPLRLHRQLAAQQLAQVALAPVKGWLMAAAPSDAKSLADAIVNGGKALRDSLRLD